MIITWGIHIYLIIVFDYRTNQCCLSPKINKELKNWIWSILFTFLSFIWFTQRMLICRQWEQVPGPVLHQGAVNLKMTNTCSRSRKWGWSDRGPHVDYSTYMFRVHELLSYPTFMCMKEIWKHSYFWKFLHITCLQPDFLSSKLIWEWKLNSHKIEKDKLF